MNTGRTVLAQLMDLMPKYEFDQCVERYQGNRRIRSMSCYDQYLIMAFAQLTGRESLRDIAISLQAQRIKLYHAGIRSTGARSTLADANETRDWQIFADFAHILIQQAANLYKGEVMNKMASQPKTVSPTVVRPEVVQPTVINTTAP